MSNLAVAPQKIPLLSLNQVSLSYSNQPVLENISLAVHPGEIVTIIGPNGAGKSSLLKTAIGLQAPSSGLVARRPKLRLGYMPQRLQLEPQLPMTCQRFLALSGNKKRLQAAVARMDIECLLNTQVHKLSGGEMQRVLLARALMKQPELLVLDEPTQGVDITGQAELYHLLGELRDELSCGVLMVSHDLHIVMAQTDQVLCLNRHICCQGAPESVSQHPEYLSLFGKEAAEDIAVYSHNHDHNHDLHGDIVAEHDHQHCQHK